MVKKGVPARLRALPRTLLYAELASAASATLLGAAAWLRPGTRVWPEGRRSASLRSANVSTAAGGSAALTFLVHALRQAIYLTPSQGRREPPGWEAGSET